MHNHETGEIYVAHVGDSRAVYFEYFSFFKSPRWVKKFLILNLKIIIFKNLDNEVLARKFDETVNPDSGDSPTKAPQGAKIDRFTNGMNGGINGDNNENNGADADDAEKAGEKASAEISAIDLTMDHKPDCPEERKRIEQAGGKVVFDGFYNYRVYNRTGKYPGLNMSRALGDLGGYIYILF